METSPPTVAEFFRGRSVLVTGALGFLGKVLVEKLLRSCPDIGNIYVLIREKRGKDARTRLEAALELPVFDRLKKEQSNALDKLVPVAGDMTSLGLALGDQDRAAIEENVSVVFNVAATVRFDDPLRSAVLMNVRGTREVLDIASNMKELKVFVHVSTTYCNTHCKDIAEKIYPASGDWRRLIQAVETLDENMLNVLTPKLLGVTPNTYTYTKGLTEQMVNEYRKRLPVIIYRPSIVVASYTEPMPGWIDNFNGPVGMFVAGGKGIMRYAYAGPEVSSDFMPVDIAIKAMVIAAWVEGTSPHAAELPVYNASAGEMHKLPGQELVDKAAELGAKTPLTYMLWLPRQVLTRSYTHYYIGVLLTHMLPAFFIDAILYMSGKKPMLTRIQRRIFVANTAVSYFLCNEWNFANERFIGLDTSILPADRQAWEFNPANIDIDGFMVDCFIGGRRYLLHEDDSTLPQARINYKRMWWLDRITRAIFCCLLGWFIYSWALGSPSLAAIASKD